MRAGQACAPLSYGHIEFLVSLPLAKTVSLVSSQLSVEIPWVSGETVPTGGSNHAVLSDAWCLWSTLPCSASFLQCKDVLPMKVFFRVLLCPWCLPSGVFAESPVCNLGHKSVNVSRTCISFINLGKTKYLLHSTQ